MIAIGAGGGCLDIFSLVCHLSLAGVLGSIPGLVTYFRFLVGWLVGLMAL